LAEEGVLDFGERDGDQRVGTSIRPSFGSIPSLSATPKTLRQIFPNLYFRVLSDFNGLRRKKFGKAFSISFHRIARGVRAARLAGAAEAKRIGANPPKVNILFVGRTFIGGKLMATLRNYSHVKRFLSVRPELKVVPRRLTRLRRQRLSPARPSKRAACSVV
jgi:hypothetical protein